MKLKKLIVLASATLGIASVSMGITGMAVSAESPSQQVPCIPASTTTFEDIQSPPAGFRRPQGAGLECCPWDQTITVNDVNCRPPDVVETTTTTTTPETTAPGTTPTTAPPAPTTTGVDDDGGAGGANPTPAPGGGVLPATGTDNTPIIVGGLAAVLFGVWMIRFARRSAH
jgi:LPXTG-motif cell wall-anchored protein